MVVTLQWSYGSLCMEKRAQKTGDIKNGIEIKVNLSTTFTKMCQIREKIKDVYGDRNKKKCS